MRILFLVVGIVSFFCSDVLAAEKPFIDNEYKMTEEQMNEETKECAAKVKGYRKIECGRTVRSKYRQEGKMRGTDEYCEKNYGQLGFDELEKLLKQTIMRMETARMVPGSEQLAGEVTYDMFGVEETWIKIRLGGMQRVKRKDLENKVFDKNQKP